MKTSIVRVRNAAEMALEVAQREFPNYHPIVSLVRLAHRSDVMEQPELEYQIHKSILPYVAPRLSSVEVRPAGDADDRRVVVSLFEDVPMPSGIAGPTQSVLEIEDAREIVRLDE